MSEPSLSSQSGMELESLMCTLLYCTLLPSANDNDNDNDSDVERVRYSSFAPCLGTSLKSMRVAALTEIVPHTSRSGPSMSSNRHTPPPGLHPPSFCLPPLFSFTYTPCKDLNPVIQSSPVQSSPVQQSTHTLLCSCYIALPI